MCNIWYLLIHRYKQKNITFEFTKGDITSNRDINQSNVLEKIYQIVDGYIKEKKLKKSDIWQIVQIFDTDGAFIPDDAVVQGETKELLYTPTQISCKDVSKAVIRNQEKRSMMNYLLGIPEIKGIPYRGYFLSSNLDHALYDIQNLPKEDKDSYANEFYKNFQGKEKLFIDFLETDVVNGCPDKFQDSWRYIKQKLHSLERHTNLHIYFKENPYL